MVFAFYVFVPEEFSISFAPSFCVCIYVYNWCIDPHPLVLLFSTKMLTVKAEDFWSKFRYIAPRRQYPRPLSQAPASYEQVPRPLHRNHFINWKGPIRCADSSTGSP